MIDREIAVEALSALCNGRVTTSDRSSATQSYRMAAGVAAAPPQRLSIPQLITTMLIGEETSQASSASFCCLRNVLVGGGLAAAPVSDNRVDIEVETGRSHIIDEDEFFDPRFDYDFSCLSDTETYRRGGEVYERPCGWQRFALKVLDKYDGNEWLGTRYRTTTSVPGEWPVSYHGTSQKGASGIIEGFYKPGPGQVYGRGIYSTPYIDEAMYYAKTFYSKKTGKSYRVILQNRINPEYRQKHNNEKYWLVPVPAGICPEEEQRMVERAIRPYGLLLKEV